MSRAFSLFLSIYMGMVYLTKPVTGVRFVGKRREERRAKGKLGEGSGKENERGKGLSNLC